ncbi:MAG: riboflavin synthase [Vicinamibacterales bacterium]
MFTGIVEATGTLSEVKAVADGVRIRIETTLAASLSPGASLAVNGVCLTVVLVDGSQVLMDIGPETARVTTFGAANRGQIVNLERPVRLDGRLDGHLVQGHVDGIGVVTDVRSAPESDSHWLTVRFPADLASHFIRKGSVAVDGVSLTVAGLGPREFDVQIIPYTWMHTTLRQLRPDDKVNLECDMIGKYVARALEVQRS